MAASKRKSLEHVEVVGTLEPAARARLEALRTWHTIPPGGTIVRFGEASGEVYFLVAGKARAVIYAASGIAVAFRDLPPGAIVGELAAIDGKPRSAGVEAVAACTVACMPRPVFLAAVRTEPAFALAMLELVAQRVRDLTQRIFEFATLGVKNRIHAELLRLARDAPSAVRGGVGTVIRPAPTHADIAARVATHREAVTREFNRLVKLGVIKKSTGSVIITDLPRLERMVNDASAE